MEKIDLKKKFKELYNPSAKKVAVVEVPDMNYLMIDGIGDPNAAAFQQAAEALFSVSYTLKFVEKKRVGGDDYTVMPLEGLWWADDMSDFAVGNTDRWKWTAMISQPDFISKDMVDEAKRLAGEKKVLPALKLMRFETVREGLSAEIMHIGPYSAVARTIQKLHDFMKENDYKFAGKHHEIYLNDPRRTAPERLKTVIRQPVANTSA